MVEREGETAMILLIFAIVVCIIFLCVEIPVFYGGRDEADFLIIVASALMLAGCIVALVFWR